MDKTIKICTYCTLLHKSNKGIETSANKWCYKNNRFHAYENDVAIEKKNKDKIKMKMWMFQKQKTRKWKINKVK